MEDSSALLAPRQNKSISFIQPNLILNKERWIYHPLTLEKGEVVGH
jgi:hypothetical protein